MEHNSESLIVVKEFTDKGKTTREVIAKGVTKQGFIDAYTEKGCVMRGGENPHFEDIYSGVVYKLENHFEQGGRLNTYEDLSKEMPSVINENSTCIPIVDLALENSPAIGSNFEGKITSSDDVVDAVNYILERTSGLENKDLVVTLLLSQNNKVKGHLFSYRSNPIEKILEQQDFFREIVSTLPAGIIIVVVGNTEKSNSNEWNDFSNSIAKQLIPFDIRFLDTLFYDFFGSTNRVSFADSEKMRSGGLVANSYPDLSKEMPSFVSEIDKDLSQNNKISLVKKDKFCGEIPNKIERSFQAAKLFYSAWNKQKIGAVEEMFVLLLTATGRIISLYKHSLGARAGTILDNTIVSAVAVQSKAKGVIVCHNHPSGNLQPSQADIKVTRNLKEALFLCGINLVDSIIITPNENSYTSIFEEGLIMKNGGEIIYEDGGQVNRERDIEIAKTILMQLGGSNRLQMFTGAYNFVAEPYGVSFRIKNRSVNYVKIVLNAMDTYDIEFGRISGVNYKIVKELSGIYNDQLVEIFTRYTGMVLRLKEGGAIQGEENAEMVMNQNLQIRHHTEELEEILKSGKEVPAWVVSKISRAADSMSDATHYLEGTPDKMAKGGNTRILYGSKLKTYVVFYYPVYSQQPQKVKRKVVYAESEKDAISQFPKKAFITAIKDASSGYSGTSQRIEELEALVKAQNRRRPSLSQQIRKEIKALKEILPLLEGKDKKVVQDEIKNLNDTLDEMRAEGQYADGGGVYDSADGISPAIQKAFNSLQNEGYFEKEAIEYVGGIKEWNKLSAREKEVIISDIEKDWSKSTFFAEGGGVNKMAMGGNTKRGRQSLSQKIRNEIKALEEMLPLLEGKDKKQVQDEIKNLNGYLDELDIIAYMKRNYADGGGVGNSTITDLADFYLDLYTTLVFDGDADFEEYPEITNLGNLQKITGVADFEGSQVQDLGKLQTIGGYANFENSKIESLGKLQTIEGDAYFENSQIESLGNLQTIGGMADFRGSQVQSLGNLQTIGGNADFEKSQVQNLGNLQTIKGGADFRNSKVQSLGNLQTIGGGAYFRNSQVQSLGNLQTIEGNAYFGDSQVQDLGNLQTIEGNAFFANSQVQSLGNLKTIGGKARFGNRTDLKAEWEARQQPMPNPNPEPDFNIEQIKEEIEAMKAMLLFLEGDDKKEIEEQIDILNIALMQNENFGGGAEKEEIKQWYRINYPDDDLGNELNDAVSFEDLWNVLHNGIWYADGSDVYEIMGVADSVLRERFFWRLTEIYGVDYDYVYKKWLDSDEPDAPNADENLSQKYYIDILNPKKGFKQERIYFNSNEEAKDWAIKNLERFDPDMIRIQMAKGGGLGKSKSYSEIKTPYGTQFSKTGDYKFVLVSKKGVNLNVWSNSKEKLEKQIDFLEKIGWNRETLEILETEKVFYAQGGGVGEPYNSMTKYQLEKELKKLTDEWFDIRKSYSTDNHPRQIEIDKEKDKIITLLYGENFSGKGQKFKYANGGGVGQNETEEILRQLEQEYLINSRKGMELLVHQELFEKGEMDFEKNYKDWGFIGKLYEWQKKYEIIGGAKNLYPSQIEEIQGFKNKIKELKSNGYLVVQKISPQTSYKKKTKNYRFIAIKPRYADGGEIFVCPVGTQIQTLIFDKSMFNLRQAKAWAKKNNFENDFVDGKLNTLRIRQKDPAMFTEDGFRTIQLRQGVQAVIGCPKKRTIRRKK